MPKINSEIQIEINPAFFIFSWQDYWVKVPTLVSIDDNKQLVAIGEKVPTAGVTTIVLFSTGQNLPEGVERLDLLQAYLEYNIAKMFGDQKIRFFKPKIIFRGEQLLNQILCGYQRSLLEIAALAAGAKEVAFE
jgi:hypothetical protein